MDADLVARVRRFNRTVTQRVGALNDAYLARDRPLGQCRVLWEIGPSGTEVRTLRSRLGLDSGYVSRLLRTLESDGLVAVDRGDADGRVRTVRLTPAGAAERAELDRRSDDLAAAILGPLTPGRRDRLVTAMAEVERLLLASQVEIAVTAPGDPAARTCLRAYAAELNTRFTTGFDPSRSISADDDELTPPRGVLLVATLHGDPVACGALKLHGPEAELKRMWTSPGVRGLGLARRMLAELESHAASRDVRLLRLETNRTLTEAITLYRSAGFTEVPAFNDEPYAHHWFEKRLSPRR